MDKKQYNSLESIAQEIANRHNTENNGCTDTKPRRIWCSSDGDTRMVSFYYTPHNSEEVEKIFSYDEIKEQFGYDVDEEDKKVFGYDVDEGNKKCLEINATFKPERNDDFREMFEKICEHSGVTDITNLTKEEFIKEECRKMAEKQTAFINQENYTIVSHMETTDCAKAFDYFENKQYDKALEFFIKAANDGDSIAQHTLGIMYENYKYLEIPYEADFPARSMYYYEASAENGFTPAQLDYGKKLIASKDSEKIKKGLDYLSRVAYSDEQEKRIEAIKIYIDTVLSENTDKETIIKAIEYCDDFSSISGDAFDKHKAQENKEKLQEKLKNLEETSKYQAKTISKHNKSNKRKTSASGCLVIVLVLILGFAIIAFILDKYDDNDKIKGTLFPEETVSTATLGEEIIELHNLTPEDRQQVTMKSTNGYTVDDTLWDGAFVYRAGSWEDTAYAIYDIGGHFEKIEFEATPWLGERHFFENSTADIMIINAETNDIIHTETINYNSGIITVEADITGVNKLGIHVKETNGYFAYTFIRNVYIYPVGTAEETSDSYKITGNIRSGAGMDYDIILASDGSTVYVATGNKVVISEDSEWYEVYIDEEKTTTGWCHSSIAEKQ